MPANRIFAITISVMLLTAFVVYGLFHLGSTTACNQAKAEYESWCTAAGQHGQVQHCGSAVCSDFNEALVDGEASIVLHVQFQSPDFMGTVMSGGTQWKSEEQNFSYQFSRSGILWTMTGASHGSRI